MLGTTPGGFSIFFHFPAHVHPIDFLSLSARGAMMPEAVEVELEGPKA